MAETEFSTKSFQLAIFIHASESLPYLRTEPDRGTSGKVNFIFRDDAGRGSQLQLEYTRQRAPCPRVTSSPLKPSFGNK